jgi:hypothetical protein
MWNRFVGPMLAITMLGVVALVFRGFTASCVTVCPSTGSVGTGDSVFVVGGDSVLIQGGDSIAVAGMRLAVHGARPAVRQLAPGDSLVILVIRRGAARGGGASR